MKRVLLASFAFLLAIVPVCAQNAPRAGEIGVSALLEGSESLSVGLVYNITDSLQVRPFVEGSFDSVSYITEDTMYDVPDLTLGADVLYRFNLSNNLGLGLGGQVSGAFESFSSKSDGTVYQDVEYWILSAGPVASLQCYILPRLELYLNLGATLSYNVEKNNLDSTLDKWWSFVTNTSGLGVVFYLN